MTITHLQLAQIMLDARWCCARQSTRDQHPRIEFEIGPIPRQIIYRLYAEPSGQKLVEGRWII